LLIGADLSRAAPRRERYALIDYQLVPIWPSWMQLPGAPRGR